LAGEALLCDRASIYAERKGLFDKAEQFARRALDLASRQNDRSRRASAMNALGLALDDLGRSTESIQLYTQAEALERSMSDTIGESKSICLTGIAEDNLGDKPNALKSCLRSLKLLKSHKGLEVEVMALNELGNLYSQLGQQPKALEAFAKAMRAGAKTKDPYFRANTLNDIGLVDIAVGDISGALLVLSKALSIYSDLDDDIGAAAIATNLANCYYQLDQPKRSLNYLQRGLRIYRRLNDQTSQAVVLSSIAATYNAGKEPTKAIQYLRMALGIQQRYKDVTGEEVTYFNLGTAFVQMGQHDLALQNYGETLSLAKKTGDKSMEAKVLTEIANSYIALNKRSVALTDLQVALPIHKETNNLTGEARTLRSLSMLAAATDLPLAIYYKKKEVNIYQRLRKNIASLDKKTRQTYKESVAGNYRSLADMLASQGRIGEAEQVLRLLKENEFYEFVRGSVSTRLTNYAEYTPIEKALDQQYEALTADLAKTATELRDLQKANKPDPEEVKRLLGKLEDGESLFQNLLDRTIGKARALNVPANTIQRIQDSEGISGTLAMVPEGTVAVYVLAAPDALRLFFFAPGLSTARASDIKAADLNRKILAFREMLKVPTSDPRSMAKELYDLLVKPLESLLKDSKAKRIMWSLDGQLRYIPMAALYDGNQFLIEKYDMSTFTPAGGSALLERDPKPNWSALVLGVSKAHDIIGPDGKAAHFGSLIGVPSELDGILKAIPNSKKLLDSDFTLESFKVALLSHPNIVHLATHFSFHPGDENNSYFITGDGKPFRVSDARTLSTLSFQGVSLLTLSACETGLGGSDGSEVEGVTAVLQKKGAESVISTLWPVEDASTAALMTEFYRLHKVHTDWSKLHALQFAQIELLNGDLTTSSGPLRASSAVDIPAHSYIWPKGLPRFSHPHYWAPFVLVGNWK
jgi:CHAT domain-containing protein/tetratricopeptide (TPR) repeat protein